jgi:hypothetical protein
MALGSIINSLIKKLATQSIRFNSSLDDLISRFEKEACSDKNKLLKIIEQKNYLSSALSDLEKGISATNKVGVKVDEVVRSIDVIVKTIKVLPIPTSIPPGIGIPLGIVNTFSDTLDKLGAIVISNKSLINQVNVALKIVVNLVGSFRLKLNYLDIQILKCLEKFDDIDDIRKEINDSLSKHGQNSSEEKNKEDYEDLENRLKLNSTNPIIYREHTLIKETSAGEHGLNKTRVVAIKDGITTVRKFYDKDDSWSYTTSLSILVDEIKHMIDIKLSEI